MHSTNIEQIPLPTTKNCHVAKQKILGKVNHYGTHVARQTQTLTPQHLEVNLLDFRCHVCTNWYDE